MPRVTDFGAFRLEHVYGREKKSSKQTKLFDREKKILCVYCNVKKNWVGGWDFFFPI
jgi:hypothetical protein